MPEWRIRGVLVGLVKADGSGPADRERIQQVLDELPGAELVRQEGQTLEIRFPLTAVDAADAQRAGFSLLRSAVLKYLAIPAMTSVSAMPVSGTVDAKAALNEHLRSAFNHLARVVGLFEEVQSDLLAADAYFSETGLDERSHQVVTSEVEDLETWSVEKMKQILTRMAALEAGSRE